MGRRVLLCALYAGCLLPGYYLAVLGWSVEGQRHEEGSRQEPLPCIRRQSEGSATCKRRTCSRESPDVFYVPLRGPWLGHDPRPARVHQRCPKGGAESEKPYCDEEAEASIVDEMVGRHAQLLPQGAAETPARHGQIESRAGNGSESPRGCPCRVPSRSYRRNDSWWRGCGRRHGRLGRDARRLESRKSQLRRPRCGASACSGNQRPACHYAAQAWYTEPAYDSAGAFRCCGSPNPGPQPDCQRSVHGIAQPFYLTGDDHSWARGSRTRRSTNCCGSTTASIDDTETANQTTAESHPACSIAFYGTRRQACEQASPICRASVPESGHAAFQAARAAERAAAFTAPVGAAGRQRKGQRSRCTTCHHQRGRHRRGRGHARASCGCDLVFPRQPRLNGQTLETGRHFKGPGSVKRCLLGVQVISSTDQLSFDCRAGLIVSDDAILRLPISPPCTECCEVGSPTFCDAPPALALDFSTILPRPRLWDLALESSCLYDTHHAPFSCGLRCKSRLDLGIGSLPALVWNGSQAHSVTSYSIEACLRHTSVALGCAPSHRCFLNLLLLVSSWLVPLCRSLCGCVALLVIACAIQALPFRSFPASRFFAAPGIGACAQCLVALGSAGSPVAILDWAPDPPSRCHKRRRNMQGLSSLRLFWSKPCTWLLLYLLGGHCPLQVWAAPHSHAVVVDSIHQWLETLPEALPTPRRRAPTNTVSSSNCALDASPARELLPHQTLIPVSIMAAGYETGHVLVPASGERLDDAFLQAALNRWSSKPYPATIALAQPQPFRDHLSAVLVPHWVAPSLQAVVIFDFSFWNGPVYAEFITVHLYYSDLEAAAAHQSIEAWDAFHGSQPQPIKAGSFIKVVSGDVIRFVPVWRTPAWGPKLMLGCDLPSLEASPQADPPYEVASPGCLTLCRERIRFFADPGNTYEQLQEFIAAGMHTHTELLSYGRPGSASSLRTFVQWGFQISRLVAAQDRSPEVRPHVRLGVFAFLDARQAGRPPAFIFLGEGWNRLSRILGYIAVSPPAGYALQVSGTKVQDDQIYIVDGCTVVVQIVPRAPAAPCLASKPVYSDNLQNAVPAPDRFSLAGVELHHAIEDIAPPGNDEVGAPGAIRGLGLPTLLRDAPVGEPPPAFINASFLVLAPGYSAEPIQIILRAPCSVEAAMAELQDARVDDDVLRHGNLILPAVQPDNTFAVVLAVPDWAADWLGQRTCILIDARALDGRLFAWIAPAQVSRHALLAQIGVRDSTGLRIAINGRTDRRGAYGMLAAGDVISITPADKRRPPVEVLEDMLRGPRNWQPCPVFLGPVETAFRVLADTQAVNVAVDFDSLHTSQDFKKLTASIFGQDIADTTICPTVPRLRNLVHCGQQCQAVLATTTRISRIPIPPGRVLPLQHIIFLDLRPILQEVTWVLAQEGQVNLPQLCEQFLVDAPEGYCVSFKDGLVRPLDTQEIVTVPHGGVLVVEFVLEYIEDSSEHFDDSDAPDNQDTEAQESSSSSSESASSNGQQCREPGMHQIRGNRSLSRSRSPRANTPHAEDSCCLSKPCLSKTAICDGVSWSGVFAQLARYAPLDSVILRCASQPIATFCTPRQLKLLTEPAPTTTAAEAALNAVRRIARRFEEAWPYLPAGAPPRVPLPGDPYYIGLQTDIGLSLLTAALLSPDTQIEQVEVWLQHPIEVDAACAEIQRYRDPLRQFFYPRIIPVWLQPSEKWATFLALPAWVGESIPICVDARLYDGRVFACVCPATVDRFTILHAAGILGQPVDVHTPFSEDPVQEDEEFQLHSGICITILPRGTQPSPILDIEVMLNFPMSWRRGPAFPVQAALAHYCVATEVGHRLFAIQPSRSWFYRDELAAMLPCPLERLSPEPAQPRIADAAVRGWPCLTVIAAASTAGKPNAPAHLVLVDCRPLLQGWFVTWAIEGWVNVRLLQEELAAFAPPGLQVELHGARVHQGWLHLAPGNWVTAYYIGIEAARTVLSLAPDHMPKPSGKHTSNSASVRIEAHVEKACSNSHVAFRTTICAEWLRRRVEMWMARLLSSAIGEGTWRLTPFLWLCQLVLWAVCWQTQIGAMMCLHILGQCGPRSPCVHSWSHPFRRGRLPWMLLLAWAIFQPAGGVQLHAQHDRHSHDRDASNNEAAHSGRLPVLPPSKPESPRQWQSRPVPTPCRQLHSEFPAVVPHSLEFVLEDDKLEDGYITLLRQSILQDATPYFLTVTLLETLYEHFSDSPEVDLPVVKAHNPSEVCPGEGSRTSPVRVLSLDSSIPPTSDALHGRLWTHPEPNLAKLCLPPPADTVMIGNTPCGFTWGELQALLCTRFSLRPFADLHTVHYPSAGDVLREVPNLAAVHPIPGWICYTDGSFYPATASLEAKFGWAALFVEPNQRVLAWLCGSVPAWAVQEVSCPSAYLAECFALLLAHMCVAMQFSDRQVTFYSDCQSAVGLAQGTMSFHTGAVPQALAHAALFRQSVTAQPGHVHYVPGHSGNIFNETVDFLAKLGAQRGPFTFCHYEGDEILTRWIQQGGARLPWAALALRCLANDPCLPPNTGHLGEDTWHGPLSHKQLVAPFLPPAVEAEGEQVDAEIAAAQLRILIVSFNTLSLGACLEEQNGVGQGERGLRYRPGRAALLAEQLHVLGATVVALQETRCPAGTSRVGRYIRFSSGDNHGQFGTEVWLHTEIPLLTPTDPKLAPTYVREQDCVVVHMDPRRLLLRLSTGRFRLMIASLHAPHRGHEHHILQSWWSETRTLLHKYGQAAAIIMAGDVNASVGSVTSAHVGDVGCEEEDLPGQNWHQLLVEMHCFLPCTFEASQVGETYTYIQKRNKHKCRPDMVGIPLIWRSQQVSAWVAAELHVALATQDHLATCVQLSLHLAHSLRKQVSRRKKLAPEVILDPANTAAIKQVLHSIPSVPWATSAHAHAAIVVRHLQDGLHALAPQAKTRPKQPYLSADTWELQRHVTAWKRSLRRLQTHKRWQLYAVCFGIWKGTVCLPLAAEHPLLCTWMTRLCFSELAHFYHISVTCKRLRRACREDRDRYIGDLARQVASNPGPDIFSALHKLLGHKRKKPYIAEPLPCVLDSDNVPCCDPATVRRRWRQHFGAMEGGTEVGVKQLPAKLLDQESKYPAWPQPSSLQNIPTITDLQRVMLQTKLGKSPGPDGVPGALLKVFAADCAEVIYPLLLKLVFRGSEAIGLKGGLAMKFWKGKGAQNDVSSFRQILLASNIAKCIHQALRPAIRDLFVSSAPSLQIGGKPGGNVVFGAHLTRSFLRWHLARKQSCFILFTDIASAFYSVVRQLVASSGDDVANQPNLAGIQLPDDDLARLLEHTAEPSALAAAGASGWLEAVSHRLTDATWFVLQQDDVPVVTSRGTRPGSSWADILFSFVVKKILRRRDALMGQPMSRAASEVSLPYDQIRSLHPCTTADRIPLGDLIWADDIATMRAVPDAASLPPVMQTVTGNTCDAFTEHGFRLSFGRNKTAILAQPVGCGARAVRRHLFGHKGMKGSLRALRENDVPVSVPLVSAYKHLGAQIAVAGNLDAEIAYRVSQARAAFAEGRRKVYKAPGIAIRRKAFILRSFVLPKLFYGSGSWPPLSCRDQQRFYGALWAFYRQILCIPAGADQHFSFATVLTLVDLPGPRTALHVQRLLYLGQLIRHAPPELWALIKLDCPYAALMQESVRWLRGWTHATCPLPDPDIAWSEWVSIVETSPGKYKGWIRRAQGLEGKRCQVVASLDGLYRALRSFIEPAAPPAAPAPRAQEVCIPCRKLFQSRVAWACHAQKIHGYRTHAHLLRRSVTAPICLACGKVYASPGRLQRHLMYSVSCVQEWGTFRPDCQQVGQAHSQAPPEQLTGTHGGDPTLVFHPGVSEPLLQALLAADPADEQVLWDILTEHIEPLQVLRATVNSWAARVDQPSAADTAENLLLLLDPELLGDITVRPREKQDCPADVAADWPDLPNHTILVSGTRSSTSLIPPPSVRLSPFGSKSITLRQATDYACWIEQACACIARCLAGGSEAAYRIECTDLAAGLGPAADWLRAVGATFSPSGVSFLTG